MPDLRAYAREAARRVGCDPDLFERQIQQESGFNPDAFNAASGATGIAQIVPRFHPDVDPRDPLASLDYAARWMAALHRQYGSYRKALAAYNWGPGRVATWDGSREALPEETRRYLDIILGPAWAEPSGDGVGAVTVPVGATNGTAGAAEADAGQTLHFRVARAERLNLRAAPSLSAAVVEALAEGTVVAPLGPAREAEEVLWLAVRAPSGAEGWASARYLDVTAAVPTGPSAAQLGTVPGPAPDAGGQPGGQAGVVTRYRVTDDGVRLRAQPGTDATILTELRAGAIVEADGADTVRAGEHSWRRVSVDGRTGWVADQFLRPVGGAVAGRRLRFDPDTPTELQVQDWTCSIRATMWMLKSIGIAVTPDEAQDRMHPRYVSRELGLLDATGAGIVACLRESWGVEAFNRAPASFDEVASYAGRCPMAIGGRAWGHWTAVRGVNAAGDLVLANPGGTGPRYGQQTLNRRQFEELGWFSAVIMPVD